MHAGETNLNITVTVGMFGTKVLEGRIFMVPSEAWNCTE